MVVGWGAMNSCLRGQKKRKGNNGERVAECCSLVDANRYQDRPGAAANSVWLLEEITSLRAWGHESAAKVVG